MRTQSRTALVLFAVLTLVVCGGCQKQEQPDPPNAESAETIGAEGYSALSDGAAPAADTVPVQKRFAEIIEQFPGQYLIDTSFRVHDTAFLGIAGVDQVVSAVYAFDTDTLRLYVTADRAGGKYLRLVEYATSQSQVRPAPVSFDEGYSAVFFHRDRKVRVMGGLKAGYLVGVVGYDESLEPFLQRWVTAIH